jgi:hypothetical protein
MIEITLERRWHGMGLAVIVQRHLAATLEDEGEDCLYGTVGAVNLPMRKTAARVGRVELGRTILGLVHGLRWFSPLSSRAHPNSEARSRLESFVD